MIPRLPIPPGTVTDLETKRAMSSFREMLKLAKEKPLKALAVIHMASLHSDPYPVSYGVIYLIGHISGLLSAGGSTALIDQAAIAHRSLLDEKPEDYLGDRRKYARGRRK